MPKQASALSTFWFVEYLRQNHSDVNLQVLVKKLSEGNSYYVENLKTGKTERVSLSHLIDTQYWFSNAFMFDLYSEIERQVPDPFLAYKVGRTSYKAQPILKTAIGIPLLGPKGILKRIVKENSKYNSTKEHVILKSEKDHVILRLIHNPGMKVGRFAMEWHRGLFEAYLNLSGASDFSIELDCVDGEKAIWDFNIRFKSPGLLARLSKSFIFNLPSVKQTIEKADEIQIEHKEQILNRDKIIEERTRELRETQAKLIETEKRTLEHRITGGFAHEMRNALSGAQLEFKTILNYQNQGKPSTGMLKESATTLLKNISLLHEEYQIPRERIAALFLPQLKTIAEIADHLAEVHAGVSSDLDRGLSITNQIREYARMSEFKKGDEPIDIVLLLKDYENRYKKEFERIGINYTVEGLETAMVKADEIHMNSIFSNLVLNAKDALEEQDGEGKLIHVKIGTVDEAGAAGLKIEVEDNGPGIPEDKLAEIFEPFFSTKPTTGTGLGLGIVKRLVQLYDGKIEVESKAGNGTVFRITLPEA